jgi:hypothetical protein
VTGRAGRFARARGGTGWPMRPLLASLAAAALAALAGCGGGSSSTTTVKTVTVDQSGKPVLKSQIKPPPAPRAAIDGQPLAGANTTIDKDPARVDIMALQRDGAVVNLTLRVSNLGQGVQAMQIAQTFDDGEQNTHGNGPFSLDGIYLVDGVGRKKYLVARDSSGQCLCDNDLSNAFVERGTSLGLSASLAAPPRTVRRVDVFVPHAGTFRSVPIS